MRVHLVYGFFSSFCLLGNWGDGSSWSWFYFPMLWTSQGCKIREVAVGPSKWDYQLPTYPSSRVRLHAAVWLDPSLVLGRVRIKSFANRTQ